MHQSEIAKPIDELTGSWNPTAGATSEDLREAERCLITTILD
jgi:hypothetical protein